MTRVYRDHMLVMREGMKGFTVTKFNPSKIKSTSIEEDQFQDKTYDLQALIQRVTDTFTKAEHDNDEMIIKTRNSVINKTTASIIQAEKSNDARLEEMINALPKYKSHISESPYDLNGLSSELVSHIISS